MCDCNCRYPAYVGDDYDCGCEKICRKCPTATAVKNRAAAATATEAATAAASVPRTAATATVAAAAAASAAAFPVFSAAVADRTYP